MSRSDAILNKFISTIWYGEPSLREKVIQSPIHGLSYRLGKYLIIVRGHVQNCAIFIVDETKRNNKFISFIINTRQGILLFDNTFNKKKANECLNYISDNLTEIVNGLKHDPEFQYYSEK